MGLYETKVLCYNIREHLFPYYSRKRCEHMTTLHKQKYKRTYVSVVACCDTMGFLHPKAVTWGDERTFQVERVVDFRPAGTVSNLPSDCYTILIKGQERQLYFERILPPSQNRVGRWFVLTAEDA